MSSSDEQALGVSERKIIRKIYGLFCCRGEWRIRWNQELYDKFDDIDVVKRIKIQRLQWLAHIVCMNSSNPGSKVFASEPSEESRGKGRRWANQMTKSVRTLGIRNWRQAEAKTCNRY